MIALALYVSLSMVLVVSHGHYGAGPVVMVVGAGLVLLGFARAPARERQLDASVILGCVLVNLALLTAGNQMIYARETEHLKGLRTTLIVAVFATVCGLIASKRVHRHARVVSAAFVAVALLAMFVAKGLVIRASPSPFIDVWTSSVAAVDFLLDGKNPYTQQYVDIYAGAYNYKPGMPYGPSFLLWSTLWASLFGGQHDVRVGLAISEVLLSLSLGAIAWRRTGDLVLAGAIALVWSSNPIGLFVLEQSWIDPLLMAALVLSFWALSERRLGLAGVAQLTALQRRVLHEAGVDLDGLLPPEI